MTQRGRTIARAARALLAGLVICQAGPAHAATFSVNPTQVRLSAKVTSALVSLRNESNEALRFQLTLHAWDQAANGEMKLAPTEDIIFFPRMLTLAPKEERRVRLGAAKPPGSAERSYRLVIEELPSSQAEATPGAVKVLTKMSIPIFVEPAAVAPLPVLDAVAAKDGRVQFLLRNGGNAHFVPDAITIDGLDADGRPAFSQPVSGWYVLAGGMRQFDVELPRADCTRAVAVVIAVQVGEKMLRKRLDTPGGPCSP